MTQIRWLSFFAIASVLIGTISVGAVAFADGEPNDEDGDGNPFQALWDAIQDLQTQIDNISTSSESNPVSISGSGESISGTDCVATEGQTMLNISPVALLRDGTVKALDANRNWISIDGLIGELPEGDWVEIDGEWRDFNAPENCFSATSPESTWMTFNACVVNTEGDVYCNVYSKVNGIVNTQTSWYSLGNPTE